MRDLHLKFTVKEKNSPRKPTIDPKFIFHKMFALIPNGLVFPEDILNEIWLMVGLESLESLHNCRQVCQIWNELIIRNIWESPSSRNIIAIRIQRNWGPGMIPSSKEISYAISYAKWLGKHRILFGFIL